MIEKVTFFQIPMNEKSSRRKHLNIEVQKMRIFRALKIFIAQ